MPISPPPDLLAVRTLIFLSVILCDRWPVGRENSPPSLFARSLKIIFEVIVFEIVFKIILTNYFEIEIILENISLRISEKFIFFLWKFNKRIILVVERRCVFRNNFLLIFFLLLFFLFLLERVS